MPPGRYFVEFDINQTPPIDGKCVDNVDVRAGSLVTVQIPAERLLKITGRVVDDRTGMGVGGVAIHCFRLKETWYYKDGREAKTDADGRYSLSTLPGLVKIRFRRASRSPTSFRGAPEAPEEMELTADHVWPDIKLVKAAHVDGTVVDNRGQPVVGADVHVLDEGPLKENEVTRTGPGGAFRLDQLDPDAPLSVWARTMVATTDGRVTVRPSELNGKLTLTIDPKFACQIRGVVTDANGKRIPRGICQTLVGPAVRKQG